MKVSELIAAFWHNSTPDQIFVVILSIGLICLLGAVIIDQIKGTP